MGATPCPPPVGATPCPPPDDPRAGAPRPVLRRVLQSSPARRARRRPTANPRSPPPVERAVPTLGSPAPRSRDWLRWPPRVPGAIAEESAPGAAAARRGGPVPRRCGPRAAPPGPRPGAPRAWPVPARPSRVPQRPGAPVRRAPRPGAPSFGDCICRGRVLGEQPVLAAATLDDLGVEPFPGRGQAGQCGRSGAVAGASAGSACRCRHRAVLSHGGAVRLETHQSPDRFTLSADSWSSRLPGPTYRRSRRTATGGRGRGARPSSRLAGNAPARRAVLAGAHRAVSNGSAVSRRPAGHRASPSRSRPRRPRENAMDPPAAGRACRPGAEHGRPRHQGPPGRSVPVTSRLVTRSAAGGLQR